MKARLPLLASFLLLALAAGSCAVTEGPAASGLSAYAPPSQHPARIGLQPMYRPFFDALKDDGDWTLIEPYGWCFRPRVNYVAWRPYLEGWWEPSDSWGWIWNTDESFGWITYHYGAWFYDSYQGWVWQPGPVWGPAWVAWVEVGDYVGWAPLGPSQWDRFGEVPGGMFTFADMRQLASRDMGQQALYLTNLPETTAPAHALMNVGRVNGVAFNRGPDLTRMQVLGAPLPAHSDGSALPRVRLGAAATRPNEADLLARTTRATTEAVREWRVLREQGVAPPPAGVRSQPKPVTPPTKPPAPAAPVARPGVHDRIPKGEQPRPAHEPAREDSIAAGERPADPAGRDSTRAR